MHEFLAIIESGRAAPIVPRVLHRALASAAVSILLPLVRERLELGPELDLGIADRIERRCTPGAVRDAGIASGARQLAAGGPAHGVQPKGSFDSSTPASRIP